MLKKEMDRHQKAEMAAEVSAAAAAAPCAACKLLRRKCGDKCVLAPYFPARDIHVFATAHRVFGASNIAKIIQEVESERREDTVRSLIYEAWARLNDPVYGCAGIVCRMHNQISLLQAQIAAAHALISKLREEHNNLINLLDNSNDSTHTHFPNHSASVPASVSPSDDQNNRNSNNSSNSYTDDDEDMQIFDDLLLLHHIPDDDDDVVSEDFPSPTSMAMAA